MKKGIYYIFIFGLGILLYGCKNNGMILSQNGTVLERYEGVDSTVIIPSSVKRIEESAFADNLKIREVKLPNTLNSIGARAFKGCRNLKQIDLPFTIREIESQAFAKTGLQHIELPDGISSLLFSTFEGCDELISAEIPGSVKRMIAVFEGCKNLRFIKLHEGIKSIDNMCFYDCENLDVIKLPNSITSIGVEAFRGCKKLKTLIIPGSVSSIGRDAFIECVSLKEVTMLSSSMFQNAYIHAFPKTCKINQLNTESVFEILSDKQFEYNGTIIWIENNGYFYVNGMRQDVVLYLTTLHQGVATLFGGSMDDLNVTLKFDVNNMTITNCKTSRVYKLVTGAKDLTSNSFKEADSFKYEREHDDSKGNTTISVGIDNEIKRYNSAIDKQDWKLAYTIAGNIAQYYARNGDNSNYQKWNKRGDILRKKGFGF